jgi:hypothetical protein
VFRKRKGAVLDVETAKKLNISSFCWQHQNAFILELVRRISL